MTNKLVVIINSLKVPKIKKMFTVWHEISCIKLQLPSEPLTRGLPPPDPRSLWPLSSTEFVEPPGTKFLGTPLPTKLAYWLWSAVQECGGGFSLLWGATFAERVERGDCCTAIHKRPCKLCLVGDKHLKCNYVGAVRTLHLTRVLPFVCWRYLIC